MAKKTTPTKEVKMEKAHILTQEQLDKLKSIADNIMSIRGDLQDLKGEDSISDIMFEVGRLHSEAYQLERELDAIVESFDTEDDDNF